MNTQKFENNLFQLEVKTENGESLFDVETVAKSLGIVDVKNDVEYVRWQRVNNYLGKNSPLVAKGDYISEPMVYKLAFKANNALAEKFQDWLATEVLPQIRKHGMYATDELVDNPDLLIEVATKLKEEKTLRLIAEQRVNELKPKVLFADAVRGSTNSCLIKDLALMLNQNGINIGQNRLFAYMRKHKYLGSGKGHYNKPTQKSMDKDLFEYREHFHTNSSGEVEVRFTPLVTGKGQEYFVNEFLDSETA
ncbi:phage antirepressor KilAC domain-containing protein [Enterococcus avium]|uniref:phage antirepressor KilAC domain-containing protein n=1 Tax=Enterococcus avium TaxID=33945 RepID=UPI0028916F8A|nr:phage antirepressor KilAC domain-containing protein [Enterococcus avium]MDT2427685.1 phage antirepressor KilAC domain-containing protein [Enterococcus avium]